MFAVLHQWVDQSQPFSLIIWASSIMYFPSLYFWLDSNACSWNLDEINECVELKCIKWKNVNDNCGHIFSEMHILNLRISSQAVFYSIHSRYRQRHASQLIIRVLRLDHKTHWLCVCNDFLFSLLWLLWLLYFPWNKPKNKKKT